MSLVKDHHGTDLFVYEDSFLEQTIADRLKERGMTFYRDYLDLVKNDSQEVKKLVYSLSNSTSQFFRNPLSFALLEQFIVPRVFTFHEANRKHEIRIWSAGCATGQEPYSVAILASEFARSHRVKVPFRIFATDNFAQALDAARLGLFDYPSVQQVKTSHLRDFFTVSGDRYRISDSIKKYVDFSSYDLLDPGSSSPPGCIFGDFDIILCCNVLLYYKPDVRKKVLQKFRKSLKPGGFFITGEAEAPFVSGISGFKPYGVPAPVFMKL
jgi:chemotaxis methyl-accepting protein methylase